MPLSKNGTLFLRQSFAHQPYLILLKSLSSIILLVMNSSTAMRGNSNNKIVFFCRRHIAWNNKNWTASRFRRSNRYSVELC